MSTQAALATFDSIRASRNPVFTSLDVLRVRWRPFDSIQSSIYVVDNLSTRTISLSPYQQDAGGDALFHHISTSQATGPPISSITVQSMKLQDWKSDWVDAHEPHAQHNSGGAQWRKEPCNRLMRCCGQDRGHHPTPFSVHSTGEDFVTVHDFVTQTHGWLQTLREDILKAMEVTFGRRYSDTRLHVALIALDTLMVVREDRPGQADRHWERIADHVRKREAGTLRR